MFIYVYEEFWLIPLSSWLFTMKCWSSFLSEFILLWLFLCQLFSDTIGSQNRLNCNPSHTFPFNILEYCNSTWVSLIYYNSTIFGQQKWQVHMIHTNTPVASTVSVVPSCPQQAGPAQRSLKSWPSHRSRWGDFCVFHYNFSSLLKGIYYLLFCSAKWKTLMRFIPFFKTRQWFSSYIQPTFVDHLPCGRPWGGTKTRQRPLPHGARKECRIQKARKAVCTAHCGGCY